MLQTWPYIDGKLFGIFEPVDRESMPGRIRAIRARSAKGYVDDGPVGLSAALHGLIGRGLWTTVNAAVGELERLYAIEEASAPIEYIWEGMFQDPPKLKKRKRKGKR